MRAALLVAVVELRRRIRNRSALFTAFVGPLVLASVFGILFSGTGSLSLRIAIVDLDASHVTQAFTSGLLDANTAGDTKGRVNFVRIESQREATDSVSSGDVDAAIVLPSGFGAAVESGQAAKITVLRDPRKAITAGVAKSIADQYSIALSSRALAVATVSALGSPAPSEQSLGSMSDTALTAIVDQTPGGREVNAAAFFGASMSILFLFFTVAFAARSLIVERKNGVVPRILATSTSASSIVIGKVLAVSLLGLCGFLTVWGVTALAFGSSWGDPLAVVVTMVATVLAVAGVATFVCGLARTEEQADGYTSATAFALALLGGNFLGPGQAPAALQHTAAFTPNGQALDAFTRIAADGASVGQLSRQLALLVVFAVVFGGLGRALIGRTVRR